MKFKRKRKIDFKNEFKKAKYNLKNNIDNYWLEIIMIFIAILTTIIYFHDLNKPFTPNKDFSSIEIKDVDNLMIVSHPGDELLWGGMHLLDENYLVVCITCGPDKEKVNEFVSVMDGTNDKYIMLGYSEDSDENNDYSEDLKNIISLKDWKVIATHNPQGEYGNKEHKLVSKVVTELVDDKNKLYYFGRYHSKKELTNYLDEMTPNDKGLKEKLYLIGLYKSQTYIQTNFDHMFEYEDWETYNYWEGGSK